MGDLIGWQNIEMWMIPKKRKSLSKHLCLYPCVCEAPNFGQQNFVSRRQWSIQGPITVQTDSYGGRSVIGWAQWTSGSGLLDQPPQTLPSHPWLRDHPRRGDRKVVRDRGQGETVSPSHDRVKHPWTYQLYGYLHKMCTGSSLPIFLYGGGRDPKLPLHLNSYWWLIRERKSLLSLGV